MNRLKFIASLVDNNSVLSDIGCDHGKLIYYVINRIKKAYAIDNKRLPLDRAYKLLNSYDNVYFSLSDGLSNLATDTTIISITGMGGLNIIDILSRGYNKLENRKLILLSHNNLYKLRKYLNQNKISILDEYIIKDRSYYEIIIAKRSDIPQNYDENDLIFGPILRMKKENIFCAKWEFELTKWKSMSVNINSIKMIKLIEEEIYENK